MRVEFGDDEHFDDDEVIECRDCGEGDVFAAVDDAECGPDGGLMWCCPACGTWNGLA